MTISQDAVLAALKRVKGPDLDGNIVDLGLVSEILIKDGRVYFSITVPPERAAALEPLREAAAKVVADIEGVAGVTAVLTAEARGGAAAGGRPPEHQRVTAARQATAARAGTPPQAAQAQAQAQAQAAQGQARGQALPGVKHLIAVASGKGGVGKSTTTVNLALGFQALGLKAGILDADVYGPSQPRLLGLSGRPQPREDGHLEPMRGYGLKVMSMGFMVDEGTPIIWRGPMVVSALNQMLRQVNWGELDVIVIDMPPGTGDVQLSIAQQVPLSGAVIVSTPQDLALLDARKGLAMFERVDVPVLGIIENMSYFLCPHCGERSEIFGHGGAEKEANKIGVPFLGPVPLHIDIRETSDRGQPIVATEPESPHARLYVELADRVWSSLSTVGAGAQKPVVTPSGDGRVLDVALPSGERFALPAEMLRVMSPSAEVQGHSPSQRVTVGGKRNVSIAGLEPVGGYAVRIRFSDGHNTGLYTWRYLEDLGREQDERWAAYLAELSAKGLSRD